MRITDYVSRLQKIPEEDIVAVRKANISPELKKKLTVDFLILSAAFNAGCDLFDKAENDLKKARTSDPNEGLIGEMEGSIAFLRQEQWENNANRLQTNCPTN